MSKTKQLEFYFDYGSPYSYLANTRLHSLCQRTQSQLLYKPVLLGGIFKITGNIPPIQNPVQSKVQYAMKDMQDWVDFYQCEFNFNPHFPVNTLNLMRVACSLQDHEAFEAFHQSAFRAIWVDKRNMGELSEIEALLKQHKLNAEEVIDKAMSDSNKEQLKSQTQAAIDNKIFGLPSFIIGDELIFGNDRLPLVEHILEKHKT